MSVTRRSFLAGASTLLASAAYAKTTGIPLARLNPKKGLAGAAPLSSGLLTRWYYNWGGWPSHKGMPAAHPGMRFFPMVWGWYPHKTPAILDALRARHPSILLGFNEPDHPDQSNIPVDVALKAWPLFEGIASELVSPAPADALGPWMQKFMLGAEKRKLRIDTLAVHHYPGPSATAFLEWLHKVHALYQRPMWVTEFAVADWQAKSGMPDRYSVEQAAHFMQTVCPEMDKIPWIKGYSWFPFRDKTTDALQNSVLFDAHGRLNRLGKLYASL